MEVRLTAHAIADIKDAAAFYDSCKSGLGAKFIEHVSAAIDKIATLPKGFTQLPDLPGEIRRYALSEFPFGIIYRVESEQVTVLVVADLRRKPGYWQARIKPKSREQDA